MNDTLAHPALGGRTPLSGGPARYSDLERWHWVLPTGMLHPSAWQDCCYII